MNYENVLAIVISYNGATKTIDTLKRLKQLGISILIVDNGSSSESLKLIRHCGLSNIHIIELHENMGIGFALNVGAKFAIANRYKWIMTMDQDSLVRPDILNHYQRYLTTHPNVRSMVPTVVCGVPVTIGRHEHEVEYAITSGHVLNLDLFKTVGFYNEELFIDCVDFDFCLRLRLANEKTVRIPTAIIEHELGLPHSKTSWLGKFYSIHSPIRRYYIYRNYFYLLKRYSSKFPKFIFNTTLSHILMLVAIFLYEKNSKENFRYILKGVLHGLIGKYGRLYV